MANNEKLKTNERQISSEIGLLHLDKIGIEWRDTVIGNDFLLCEDLPLSYEELVEECNIILRLKTIHKICLIWLEENDNLNQMTEVPTAPSKASTEDSELENSQHSHIARATSNGSSFWSFLIQEEKLDLQALLALLAFFIDRGSVLSSLSEDREKGFAAANLYLVLICIPGSMAFRVYHQMLYLKTLQLNQLFITASKKSKSAVMSKKSQSKQSSFHEIDGDEEICLSDKDISILEKKMLSFLDCLSLVAQKLSLRRYPNILKETIESMLPVISLGLGSISVQALEIVQCFCNPLHGDAIQTVHYIFLHILPYLALDPNEKDLNNKELVALKDISFRLVRSFICKFGASIYSLVQGLVKHVCIDVVDRAEYRQKTAQTALDLLNLLPEDHQKSTIRWFLLLAHSEQASLRLFAMEIFALLLQRDQISVLTLAVIFSQCSDASSSVRAKALFIFGECIESKHSTMVDIFNTIFSSEQQQTSLTDREETDLLDFLQEESEAEISSAMLPSAAAVLGLLKERAIDEKVYVRKSALQLILTLVKRNRQLLTKDILKLLGDSCMDVALLIRRHMAQMLTELVASYQDHLSLKNVWVRSVLPLVMDRENRVQEKTLECLDQLILKSLVDDDSMLGWSLLEIITEQGLVSYLSKAIETFARQKMLSPRLIKVLLDNTEQHGKAALTSLAVISRHTSPGSNVKKFALSFLQQPLRPANSSTVYCMQQVYKILGCSVPSMNSEDRQLIRSILSQQIESFNLSTELIGAACDLVVFCIQQESEDEEITRKESVSWATTVLSSCGEYLSTNLRRQESVQPDEEEQLARRIYTLGCVALHCPWSVNKRHFLMIQHAAFQPESGIDIPIPCSQTQPTRKLPERLQAAAVVSLGKLGVQHEEKAKQLVPGLGKLLETTPYDTIRNNIVCILCDWVVRYATAIDPVMPQVTACLRDPNPVVRKQTLVLLIHLLQEDYLKIRGTFFFRILQLTCDDDESLSDLALFYVTQRLLHRQSNIIQQHFIESIFHFNDYRGHPSFNKFALTDRERKLFSIAGPPHSKRRFQIYVFMLQNLDDEARFQLTFRLSRDVLFGVVEGVMPLKNSSTEAVLKDTLAILASDDIKLASLKTVEEDPIDKEDIAQAIVQSTKKAIIAQVVKRNVIENIIPIVMELKRKLASLKSPLMGDLMQFLRELMKDYKNEIQEVLAADRQLMAEIEFDLKRFEQQEQTETARRSVRVERSQPAVLEAANTELENPRRPSPKSVDQSSNLPNEIDEQTPAPDSAVDADVDPGPSPSPITEEATVNQPESSVASRPDSVVSTVEPISAPSANHRKKRGKVLQQLDPPALPIMIEPRPEFIVPTSAEPEAVIDGPSTSRRKKRGRHPSDSMALPNTSAPLPSNQPRIMSTPIKPNTELTFDINDPEMSIIPHADHKASKRRRP